MTRPWSCPDCGGRLLWGWRLLTCSACPYLTGRPAPGRLAGREDGEEHAHRAVL